VTIKANEVYRTLREGLRPWFQAEGFRRTKGGMLGWYKAVREAYLVVGFYCMPPAGGDPFYGSSFTVQFELSRTSSIGASNVARLDTLLSQAQLNRLLDIQNAVVAKLKKPDKNHHIFRTPQVLIDQYLSEFEPLTRDKVHWYNQWLSYHDAEDVRQWTKFLLELFPKLVNSFMDSATPGTD